MSEDPPQRDPGAPQAGVLGNLPHSRPAVRSPRRSEPAPKPRRDAADPATDAGGASGAEGPADLEALARGGIAVAGEAVSLGLRLAGRAAAALRDAVERR